MTMIAAPNHIVLDDKGRPKIEGTRTRVTMIVMDKMSGMDADRIHAEYSYLSLAQIHAALSYYYDHQAELDKAIADELAEYDAMREAAIQAGDQPTLAALKARFRAQNT